MRRGVVFGLAVLAILCGWFAWRTSSQNAQAPRQSPVLVEKEPPTFLQRTFDPAAPPADMPPMSEGETAECDSNFISNAKVSGTSKKQNATHAIVTVTQVRITLQLKINIWVPDSASEHVIEHEQGHREISEHYYQFADKVAAGIAAPYIGRQLEIEGPDLDAAFSKALLKLSSDITAEYNDKLNLGPAQQSYDDLTDHSRNSVSAKDAVAQALQQTASGAPANGIN